ncbi:MAG: polyprenyl synthetase family protein [Myxococcales bacterium]|nr:polyprenyl synthetase family protein [Myxococcales bacterium]
MITPTIDPGAAPAAARAFLDRVRPAIEAELARRLGDDGDAADDPGRLREAMRYAALGPGKRLRPALVVAACEACGGDPARALPAAAAVELLHAYTLVHDDLPAMDDDDERRGRPTVHVAFGEAIAILAGDGLLTAAFAALADLGPACADAVAALARRAGARELLAGQAIDLALLGGARPATFAAVEDLHARKTGALFAAACELGAIAAGAGEAARTRLGRYGLALGVAFQHADDRDDGELAEHAAAAAARIAELGAEATALARDLGPAGQPLVALAAWIGGVGAA